jgi:hypothetical protein
MKIGKDFKCPFGIEGFLFPDRCFRSWKRAEASSHATDIIQTIFL